MSPRPVLDAGPALNFLATNHERLLFDTLGPISTPEIVRDEVLRKARTDSRFERAARVWTKLPYRLLEILPDDEAPELSRTVTRLGGLPMAERIRQGKDLGEVMVVAHAVLAAESGQDVTVVIDDGQGHCSPRRRSDAWIGCVSRASTSARSTW